MGEEIAAQEMTRASFTTAFIQQIKKAPREEGEGKERNETYMILRSALIMS
ncbi:hypothetical protein I2494_18110 [Budviciaceae bacterium BWR-B9]|uniref:Uncharacterized protein n=1 Tax=Limnobaculum allomyrinae TaxID=2791986 RepID=A0ABS1IV92_9GAMM|nr:MULTISPECIES: hypothetical protein [Limnobaculum]MBK5145594.1 hypothetical protein [Limnobaculum allomyrinae]MBV7693713.1 hypothetical protein [Limnobaculum sp. M2-1]